MLRPRGPCQLQNIRYTGVHLSGQHCYLFSVSGNLMILYLHEGFFWQKAAVFS